jgi:dTDP-4-dehydrorhamnose reductase
MRVLVTGAGGMLGQAVVRQLSEHEVVALPRAELDIADPMSIGRLGVGEFGKFDWVVNCAAYTKVDLAEAEREAAYDANATGVAYLGQACRDISARLVHISTDFVFDGTAERPYVETGKTNPLGVYGASKLAGEERLRGLPNVWILRTSWLFGPDGPCFPRTMLRAHRAGKNLRVVADQRGNPTYTGDLARSIQQVVENDPFPDLYHVAGPETMTWHEFAGLTLAAAGCQVEIEPIGTDDWPTPARRPAFSALDSSKALAAGIGPLRGLEATLPEFLQLFPD